MANSDSSVTNLFGELPSKTSVCEKHGEYVSTGHRWKAREIWSGCETCANEAEALRRAEQAEADARERKEREMARLIGRSAIPKRFIGKRFDNYEAVNASQQHALATCRDYANNFDQVRADGASLILCGKPGTGKTHLACAIANELMGKQFALFARVFDAIRTIKSTWARNSEQTETEAIQSFIRPDLLILDEVGMQFGSDAEMLLLFEIINGRYEAVKPTIILSNLPISELKTFLGERVMDRLREGGGKYIAFDWESQRGKL